ncbi:MAG: class B sortase [Defluviitaleaceae bacterium]|nr:class B sortase [Defluviitaleaceae bacterium]
MHNFLRKIDKRVVLFSSGVFFICAALLVFAAGEKDYAEAEKEYAQLRAYSPVKQDLAGYSLNEILAYLVEEQSDGGGGNDYARAELSIFLPDNEALLSVNPDYIGWLTVSGTSVDYPVVQCADNEKYVATTFAGKENPSGSIFLDRRNSPLLTDHVSVVYGHNMKNGSMFAPLVNLLNDGLIEDDGKILFYTAGGELFLYKIIYAVRTDINDPVYKFENESGQDGSILVLSTCILGAEKHVRLVVAAELTKKIY